VIDRDLGLVSIKPSGMSCAKICDASSLVIVSVESGLLDFKQHNAPSVDTPIHLELYRAWSECAAVVHTHSRAASTISTLRGCAIPVTLTMHADHFSGPVPIVPFPSSESIAVLGYEAAIGRQIVGYFKVNGIDPMRIPGTLMSHHGPIVWGKSADEALTNALVIEEIAANEISRISMGIGSNPLPASIADIHYYRKHGGHYGQPK
jgi:L-ribulose-5-phosphate 4-epimerase